MSDRPGNLATTRVLDLTHESGFLTGKVLGELGADVVKVEPPAGDAARRRPPFAPGGESILWLALNTSKRGITLDLERPRGRELFLQLAEHVDVVVESDAPGAMARRGLGWAVLSAANPRLVLCSLTPFGQDGPRAGWRGSDLAAVAMSGNLFSTGDPDRPPVRCTLPVAHYHGGLEGALATVFALLAREKTGRGQHLDVSLQQAMVMPNIGTAAMFAMTGNRGARVGAFMKSAKTVQREIWPCKDGFVSFALRGGPARVPGLVAMVGYMDEHGMASDRLKAIDWKRYNHNLLDQDEVDELTREFGAFFATKTMSELYAAACARNLMLAPINTAREIVASEQLAAREFFVDVGGVRHAGPFAITSAGRDAVAIRRPAPQLGEHTAEVLAGIGLDPADVARLREEGIV